MGDHVPAFLMRDFRGGMDGLQADEAPDENPEETAAAEPVEAPAPRRPVRRRRAAASEAA